MNEMHSQHRELLLSLSSGLQASIKSGIVSSGLLKEVEAFNRNRSIQGSYPFQVVSDDDEMMGMLTPDQARSLIDTAQDFSLEGYFLQVNEEQGWVSLFFGYSALPLASRLFPQGFSFVHVGENSLVLDDFQAIGIRTLDKPQRIYCQQQLMAMFNSAN